MFIDMINIVIVVDSVLCVITFYIMISFSTCILPYILLCVSFRDFTLGFGFELGVALQSDYTVNWFTCSYCSSEYSWLCFNFSYCGVCRCGFVLLSRWYLCEVGDLMFGFVSRLVLGCIFTLHSGLWICIFGLMSCLVVSVFI